MPPSSPPDPPPIAPPHPLALHAIERLRDRPGARVLDYCSGSGRNAAALRDAGFDVVTLSDQVLDRVDALRELGPFAAALSTHGLLHGTMAAIAASVAEIAASLERHGGIYATFGSTSDARFGRGTRLGASTFAPNDGDERGVAHTYFTRTQIADLFASDFVVEELAERSVDAIAGSWAHPRQPLCNAVHWFVIARRRFVSSRVKRAQSKGSG